MNAIISTNSQNQILKSVKLQQSLPQNQRVFVEKACDKVTQHDNSRVDQEHEHTCYEESLMREMLYFDRF